MGHLSSSSSESIETITSQEDVFDREAKLSRETKERVLQLADMQLHICAC